MQLVVHLRIFPSLLYTVHCIRTTQEGPVAPPVDKNAREIMEKGKEKREWRRVCRGKRQTFNECSAMLLLHILQYSTAQYSECGAVGRNTEEGSSRVCTVCLSLLC